MDGYITLSDDSVLCLMTIAINDFIYTGSRRGLDIVRYLKDADGRPAPIDELIAEVLIEEGRLLTA